MGCTWGWVGLCTVCISLWWNCCCLFYVCVCLPRKMLWGRFGRCGWREQCFRFFFLDIKKVLLVADTKFFQKQITPTNPSKFKLCCCFRCTCHTWPWFSRSSNCCLKLPGTLNAPWFVGTCWDMLGLCWDFCCYFSFFGGRFYGFELK